MAVGAGDSQGIIGFGWDRLAARSCPDCGEAMKEMSVKQMPDIPIDRCAKCNQVWFDDGELSMVAAEAQKAQQKRMLDA